MSIDISLDLLYDLSQREKIRVIKKLKGRINMYFKKAACVISALCIVVGGMSGCTKKSQNTNINSDMPTGEITYPIKTDETLTYWVRLANALSTSVTNFAETEFAKEYMRRTGINVEYKHPAQGTESESINLLLASGELPDIIEYNWLSLNPDSAIEKKNILALNDYIENYSPNLKKWLSEHPDINKQIVTDNGNYYVYPFIRNDDKLQSTSGFMLRGDWLKELGLEVPETIDEWRTVLTAFRDKKNSTAPFGGMPTYFMGAYGISPDFYIDNGKVHYGYYEPALKEYLIEMNEWYNEELLDKNFAVMDGNQFNSDVLNNIVGAMFGAGGGTMGMFLNAKAGSEEPFELVAAKFPSKEKGKKAEFGNKQWQYSPVNGAAITTQSKNPALAARFLDYSYSEEGSMLNNFGIEGVSYNIIDGYPTFSEVITKNPDGLSMAQAIPLYARSANEGPFIQDVKYIEQYYALDAQKDALVKWSDNNDLNHRMPQITLTREEASRSSKIMSDVRNYCNENTVKFILGSKSIDELDEFFDKLKGLGIEEAIDIQQAAYDRFMKR